MGHIFMFMPVLGLALFIVFPWQRALIAYLPITAGSLVVAYKGMAFTMASRSPFIASSVR
jgi:hypothetical protein